MKEEREAVILIFAILPALFDQHVHIYSTIIGGILASVRTIFFPPVVPLQLQWILAIIYFSIAILLFLRSSSVSLT